MYIHIKKRIQKVFKGYIIRVVRQKFKPKRRGEEAQLRGGGGGRILTYY